MHKALPTKKKIEFLQAFNIIYSQKHTKQKHKGHNK